MDIRVRKQKQSKNIGWRPLKNYKLLKRLSWGDARGKSENISLKKNNQRKQHATSELNSCLISLCGIFSFQHGAPKTSTQQALNHANLLKMICNRPSLPQGDMQGRAKHNAYLPSCKSRVLRHIIPSENEHQGPPCWKERMQM